MRTNEGGKKYCDHKFKGYNFLTKQLISLPQRGERKKGLYPSEHAEKRSNWIWAEGRVWELLHSCRALLCGQAAEGQQGVHFAKEFHKDLVIEQAWELEAGFSCSARTGLACRWVPLFWLKSIYALHPFPWRIQTGSPFSHSHVLILHLLFNPNFPRYDDSSACHLPLSAFSLIVHSFLSFFLLLPSASFKLLELKYTSFLTPPHFLSDFREITYFHLPKSHFGELQEMLCSLRQGQICNNKNWRKIR